MHLFRGIRWFISSSRHFALLTSTIPSAVARRLEQQFSTSFAVESLISPVHSSSAYGQHVENLLRLKTVF